MYIRAAFRRNKRWMNGYMHTYIKRIYLAPIKATVSKCLRLKWNALEDSDAISMCRATVVDVGLRRVVGPRTAVTGEPETVGDRATEGSMTGDDRTLTAGKPATFARHQLAPIGQKPALTTPLLTPNVEETVARAQRHLNTCKNSSVYMRWSVIVVTRRYDGGTLTVNVNRNCSKCRNLKILVPLLFAESQTFFFDNSQQAYANLRRFTLLQKVYLQHGGGNCC